MIRLIKRIANRGREKARRDRDKAINELRTAKALNNTQWQRAAQEKANKATERALRMGV